MARRRSKKARLKAELEEAQTKKRSGLIRTLGAIAIVIVAMIIKTVLSIQGVEWATNSGVNMVFYLFIIVMAAVAGIGARDWYRSKRKADEIRGELGR